MTYNLEQMARANRSCRDRGAIGTNPVLLSILEHLDPANIGHALDYGAGKKAKQARYLNTRGWKVTAHEFGENYSRGYHDPHALSQKYGLIYASNVLNVQGDLDMLAGMLSEIRMCLHWNAPFYCNYPRQPRYIATLTDVEMEGTLRAWFSDVQRLPRQYNGVIFKCEK